MNEYALNRRDFVKSLGVSVGLGSMILNAAHAKEIKRKHIPGVAMALTDDQIAILNGRDGEVMAKILKSIVLYGDTFEAPYLVPIEHDGHWVTGMGQKGLEALFDLCDIFINAGIKAKRPFTIDPYPVDNQNIDYTPAEAKENDDLYQHQKRWDIQVQKLGIRDAGKKSFSCTCYLPEVGNTPKYGEPVAWAESSAVVFVNSVIGARCNRNSGPIEILSSLCGYTPYFGFLTDDGRKADWVVEIKTSALPTATLLGSAIGMAVGSDVPFIVGLDKYLGNNITEEVIDYLKDFGAATASNGAVGLYHVENLTPEAKKFGKNLLKSNYKKLVITDEVLAKTKAGYPILWKDLNATPRYAIIGCPHLTLSQITKWDYMIDTALRAKGKKQLEIPIVLCASPFVIEKLTPEQKSRLQRNGARITYVCGAMWMINKVSRSIPHITNSNKLRTYSTSRFYEDQELLSYAVTGKAPVQKA